jgi:hypothetical protein
MRRPGVAAAAIAVALAGCAKDMVLPDLDASSTCGNGIVESGEQCDLGDGGLAGVACVSCMITPGWTCPNNTCVLLCGDGVVGDGGTCTARDTACDMTGYWAARETEYTRDSILGGIQTSSAWSLFKFQQTGNDFQVAEELDCGVHVTGSATVDLTPAGARANLYLNRMDGLPQSDGGLPRPPRHGTSQPVSGGCSVTLQPWFKVRGATDVYLPADFSTNPRLSTLMPLPTVMDFSSTSTEWPMGATDPDGDGIPGIAYQVKGLLSGVRNAVEREVQGYATHTGAPVPAAALTLVLPDEYDDQESVMRLTGCGTPSMPNAPCSNLLAAGANVDASLRGRMTLTFIGRTYGSPRVSPVVVGTPRQNPDFDTTTCSNVQRILPHDDTPPVPTDAGLQD